MSMLVFGIAPHIVVIAGDRYQKLEQRGAPPIENNGAQKIVRSANARVAVGLCGDLPLLPGAEACSPQLWFERHFAANDYFDLIAAVNGIVENLAALTPPAKCVGGSIVVGGFIERDAVILQLHCASRSDEDWSLSANEISRATSKNGVFLGSIGGYATFEENRAAARIGQWDGVSDLCGYCRGVIDGVATAFVTENRSGISGPAEAIAVVRRVD